MSGAIISSMALGRARTAAGGTAEPYFWFIMGRDSADVRADPKDAGITGLQMTAGVDYPLTTLDTLITETVREDSAVSYTHLTLPTTSP